MRLLNEEDTKRIPRLSPTRFTQEESARQMDLDANEMVEILELQDGWNLVGWASASDVAPRDMCPYVILCEREDGFRAWCHIATVSLELIIMKVEADPSRIIKP